MNPEEEKTIPVQATDADLTNAPADAQEQQNLNPQSAAGMETGYNAGANQANTPYGGSQGYQQNPNAQFGAQGYPQNSGAQYGAGVNAAYNAGTNQTNAQYSGMQGYQQNPGTQYGAGTNTAYNAGMNQNNNQYGNAQSFTQGFQNMTGGAGMNAGNNTGTNQANAQYGSPQGYQQNQNAQYGGSQGYQQNQNAQYGGSQGFQQNQNTQYGAGMNNGYNAGTNQNHTQYGNAQGYQNPYYVNPGAVPNAAAKKKSKKKIWIPIVSVVLVAALAVGIFFLVSKKTRNPEEVITTAMSNTFSAERTSSTAGWLHSQDLDTLTTNGAYQLRSDMTITKIGGYYADDLSMLEGLGISTSAEIDINAARYYGSASILYGGTSYLDYTVYAYDDYIAIACPSLFEGYIEFKTSNFGSDFNHSPLAEAMNTQIDPSIAFRFFDLFTEAQKTETEIPRELQDFFDAIRYEQGDKKDLQVNGKSQTCQGYNIVITRASMEHLVKWFCDYAESLGTPIAYEDVAPMLPSKDFVMTVYVDNKGRMARFCFDFPLESAQTEVSCQIDFTGLNDDPASHITGQIKLNVGGYAYGFSFESTTDTAGSTETQNTTMSIDVSGISVANATYMSTFDTQTGTAHMDLSVSAMYMSILSLNMDYSYSDVVPGESFTLNIDDFTLDVAGELTVSLYGSSSVSKLSGSVSEPSGTKYDLFAITEEDVMYLGTEIYQNMLDGPLSFLLVELYKDYYWMGDDDLYGDGWGDDDWY